MTARTLIASLAAAACLLAGASAASAAAPVLKLSATSQPTNFTPGTDAGEPVFLQDARPQTVLMVTNVGSAPTSGPITITDTLPAGLTPRAPLSNYYGEFTGFPEFPCSVIGQTVTCTAPKALQPGHWARVMIGVKVDESLSGTVVNQASVVGGGAAEASTSTTITISDALPSFGFDPGRSGFSAMVTDSDGGFATQAGSHPYGVTLDFGFPSAEIGTSIFSADHLRDLRVNLPRGMVANPSAIPAQCTEVQLESEGDEEHGGCPDASQVGLIVVQTNVGAGIYPKMSPLYNMVPPPGTAAELAFDAIKVGFFIHLMGRVNSAGEYELGTDTNDIVAKPLNPLIGVQAQIWGDPSAPSHDALRGPCVEDIGSCTVAAKKHLERPFLTMPGSCRETLSATAIVDSWEEPANKVSASAEFEDPLGNPTGTDGCNKLEFAPEVEAKPTTNLADAPSGLEFKLHVPQIEDFDEPATANFKDVKVALPEGMAVNPSSGNGLSACSSAQVGLITPVGQSQAHFNENPGACPEAAKLGSVEVSTPLLDHLLPGAVYLAKPFDNPFNSLIALYLDVEDPATGTVAKLAGRVEPNPQTGQLTTVFKENPELPIEDVKLSLSKGPRAPLTTPIACGTYSTTADITPWSTPEGVDVHLSDSFATVVGAAGSGPCPASEAGAPNNPSFTAGTVAPQAGAYSPFVLKLSREDGSQRLVGLNTTLPKGLIAKIAGLSYCPEGGIAQAIARSRPNEGALEQASPSCPASSELGTLDVAAGSGITPLHAQGHAYLAGPYKGAPLSLIAITPALAGPFDLGAVAVRVALQVDPETATVQAVSDPLPTILDGIPLDVRSVALKMDRPDFTLNPTSCDPMAVTGAAISSLGSAAALTSPFQVGGCSSLGFKPKLAFNLKGATKRTGHPALKATVTYPKGAYANIAKAQVTLPKSEFLDQGHIQTICTRVQFAAKNCPPGAVYGFAKATTPLLDGPLSGPVYLRSSSHELPDLVADLNGQIPIVLAGRIDSVGHGIRTTFEGVPDAPISKFTLEMKGGKKGLLINSIDLCKQTNRAVALFDGQNGKTYDAKPALAVSCKGKGHKKGKGKGHGKAHR